MQLQVNSIRRMQQVAAVNINVSLSKKNNRIDAS